MPNDATVPVISFQQESGRPNIEGKRDETLYQTVERNWHNLSNAVLRRFNANRIDLCDGNLQHADLYSADFTCARLTRAKLAYASLYGASLVGADLQHADLSQADLYRADMRNADLRHAVLTGTNLERAVMNEADLRGAIYNSATRFPVGFDPTEFDLRNLDLPFSTSESTVPTLDPAPESASV